MEAELSVLEIDGASVEDGSSVDVVVVSRPDEIVHGTVASIDKLAQAGDGSHTIKVVVALERTDPSVMKPGQRVHASIVSMTDAIAVPRQAIVERDGASLVYRRGAHGFEPTPVQLGGGTAGLVAITSGLVDGDVIRLGPTQGVTP
jgi:hypothetical protein